MNNNIRSRIVLPIAIPIVILVSMAAFIGSVAALLLYNTKLGATALAAVAAAGILFTISLAASHERLTASRRGVVLFAAALPLLAGAGVAFGVIGDLDDADRMINVQPLTVVPEGAPVIAAENSTEFCLGEAGSCEPVDVWEVEPSPESDTIAFIFDNREAGVPHNVQIMSLEGTVENPEPGSEVFATSAVVNGPTEDAFVQPDGLTWEELPEEWYFMCVVHPVMNGVGVLASSG